VRAAGRTTRARAFVAVVLVASLGGLTAAPAAAVGRPVASAIVEPAAPARITAAPSGGIIPGIDIEVPTGSHISGTITAGGNALAGVDVTACLESFESCRLATTDANGDYTVDGLAPGFYLVEVQFSGDLDAIPGWYTSTGPVTDYETAESIDATSGDVSGIDLDLDAGHRISGTIVGGGSTPLPGVFVFAGSDTGFGSTETDANGAFTIRGLADGSYTLGIDVPQPLNYRSGSVSNGAIVPASEDGSPVVVSGANVTGIDIDTPAGRRISGTLTGSGAAGATVYAIGIENGNVATVAGNGSWQVVGLWPDSYQLLFLSEQDDFLANLFPFGYWDGGGALSLSESAAVEIVISNADRTGINASIPNGTTISGSVRADDGAPVDGAYIYACAEEVGCVSTPTDGSGAWAIDRAAPGDYLIQAFSTKHSGGFFGPGGIADTEPLATTVKVGTADRPGVDFVLPTGLAFSGTITGPGSVPVEGASLIALGTGGISPVSTGGDWSAADGSFTLAGLRADEYVIAFSFELDSDFLDGYYADGLPGNFTTEYDAATILVLDEQGVGNSYVPITPTRVVDSRTPLGVGGIFLGGVPQTFDVAGVGVIPADAVAVTGNVTVVGQTAGGYVSITPSATANPSSSTINVPLGDIRANNFTSPLAGDGSLAAVYKSSAAGKKAHVIVDITGFFREGDLDATYHPIDTVRVMDTRPVGHIGSVTTLRANVPQTLSIAGGNGIPADAVAITGNLTVVGQTRAGLLSITPNPVASPTTSTLNFPVGDIRANGVSAPLNAAGDLSIVYGSTGGTANAILDVTGYYLDDPSGLLFYPLPPGRLMDTRPGVLASGLTGLFGTSGPRRLDAAGRAGVPLGAAAVTGNLTVVGQTAAGFVSITKASVPSPTTSTINFPLRDTRANGVTVPLAANGAMWLVYKSSAAAKKTHVILDVTGYFK
jgi:hypothetical protein